MYLKVGEPWPLDQQSLAPNMLADTEDREMALSWLEKRL